MSQKIRIPRQPSTEFVLAKDRYGNKILLCGNADGGNPDLQTDGRVLLDHRLAGERAAVFSRIADQLNRKEKEQK